MSYYRKFWTKKAKLLKKADDKFYQVGWKYVPPETTDPVYTFESAPGGHGFQCPWCSFTENEYKKIKEHALHNHRSEYYEWKHGEQRKAAEQRVYDFYFFGEK